MASRDLFSDEALARRWAEDKAARFEACGVYASWWLHSNGKGFGFVLVDESSGEFHVLPGGKVTKHVERAGGELVLDGCFPAETLEDLEREFRHFAGLIAPDVASEI
jgi:hypothetical protein